MGMAGREGYTLLKTYSSARSRTTSMMRMRECELDEVIEREERGMNPGTNEA
jgi:hypothetical protein